jgi:hypothetical protein
MGDEGTEHTIKTPIKPHLSEPSGAECGAVGAADALPADLAAVVRAWPSLPAAVKAGIVALVKAARGPDQ